MTTAKQRTANRRNAQKSTGPKSPEGKATIRLNAMKHGLLSREVLLPDEDETALVELGKRLRAQLQPVGELEGLLVDRIVTVAWRLRRLLATETSLFQEYRKETYTRQEGSLGDIVLRDHGDRFTRLFRYETTLERALYKALHELQRLQAARAGQAVPPPAALDVDVNVSTSPEVGMANGFVS
jgi:hypothetical protein